MTTKLRINGLLGSVPKLTGENYLDWKFAVQMVLHCAECWDVVSGKAKKPKKPEDLTAWEEKAENALKRQFYGTHSLGLKGRAFVDTVLSFADQLRAVDVELSDDDVIDVLIMGLAEEYSALAAALGAVTSDLMIKEVVGAIIDEEARIGKPLAGKEAALLAKENRGNRRTITCYGCQKEGHIQRDCPEKKEKASMALDDLAY
ncbi:hypothetical protein SISSUDRAFT_1061691 [Sistotremastrum suecicum HHB10207 ss-3]|uniref:CCHC-type domain-containing protein n=1 Tax=Sistotremastrum suecicum HHB10207 ss-3 TaxID=1314776 RepID=A0A166DPI9_9AGAM|nr:hypothetical protein SISSUDRAFT_1061691 [Sistotremastrum suecicum HHB10207 ss-3]